MDNFLQGLKAIGTGAFLMLKEIFHYELFWGFALGFFIASIVYGFLVTDSPKHVPLMLFHDKSVSFEKIHERAEGSAYTSSFYDFSKKADQVKKIFLTVSVFGVLLILIALI